MDASPVDVEFTLMMRKMTPHIRMILYWLQHNWSLPLMKKQPYFTVFYLQAIIIKYLPKKCVWNKTQSYSWILSVHKVILVSSNFHKNVFIFCFDAVQIHYRHPLFVIYFRDSISNNFHSMMEITKLMTFFVVPYVVRV